jgi:hypothetical protein
MICTGRRIGADIAFIAATFRHPGQRDMQSFERLDGQGQNYLRLKKKENLKKKEVLDTLKIEKVLSAVSQK